MITTFGIAPLSSRQILSMRVPQRSANSPQELQKRPFLVNFVQLVKHDVSAGQWPFSAVFNTLP